MNLLAEYGPGGLFFAFLIAHALADFPLQGAYLAREKVRSLATDRQTWFIALTTHAVIQGGGVWLVSGSLAIGLTETALHWLIDWAKGEDRFNLATDQLLHIACKVGYTAFLVAG